MTRSSRTWFGSVGLFDEAPAPVATPAPIVDDAPERRSPLGLAMAARIVAVVGTFALMSALVISTSQATFSDPTDSSTNAFTAGTIDLIDDDSGSALFNVANMEPGQTEVDCIRVTYQGNIPDPSRVSVYSGGYTDSGDFATYLNLTIEEGTNGTYGDCTGFTSVNTIESGGTLAAFDSAHTNYANGAGVWDPSSTPASMTYRITVELDGTAPNAEQGESVSDLVFTWEIQN